MDRNELIHQLLDLFRFKEEYHLQSTQLLVQDLYVLERLYFTGPTRVLEFAQRYNLPPSTLTGIVDRLIKRELIRRERSEEDRKMVELSLTEKGNNMVELHLKEDERFVQSFFGVLEPEKGEQLTELLTEVLTKLNYAKIFDDGGEV